MVPAPAFLRTDGRWEGSAERDRQREGEVLHFHACWLVRLKKETPISMLVVPPGAAQDKTVCKFGKLARRFQRP